MQAKEKIIPRKNLKDLGEKFKRIVLTNGCFDLLHAGHVQYLEKARAKGDCLVVALNGDESVRKLKGKGRPLNNEKSRAIVLAGLQAVDFVVVFPEERITSLIEELKPQVYVKGGDYALETLDKGEREALERIGCKIVLEKKVPGYSTSETLKKIRGR